jgi:plastocyanin
MRVHLVLVSTLALGAAVLACSSSDDKPPPSSSGGTASSSSGQHGSSNGGTDGGGADAGGTDAGGTDAGPPGNCTTFTDHTAAGDARTLTWSFAISTDPNRCMKIKVGQAVTWQGDFTAHPLVANDGDKPNPIANVDTSTGKVTFNAAGTFGYKCSIHPAMFGAIEVVP